MDEMKKKPMGEDTLNDIVAQLQAESDPPKPAAQSTSTVEVDEKFRSFFTTTVAVIPEDSAVSGRVETEPEQAPAKKGLFGWLGGLFRSGRQEQPELNTGEVMIPGKTQPKPAETDLLEQTVETTLEVVDETQPIDLKMMGQMPESAIPGDATGEIRLADLEEALSAQQSAEEKPARKSGGIRFLAGDGAEKPAPKKKEKKPAKVEQPAAEPIAAAVEPAQQPAEVAQPAVTVQPAETAQPAKKLTFEDIDIAAILAAGAAGQGSKPAETAVPAVKAEEQQPVRAEKPVESVLTTEEQPAAASAEDATRELTDLSALSAAPARLEPVDEPTGEIRLFPSEEEEPAEEQPVVMDPDTAATREVSAPAAVVEHSTHQPQVVAVEQPTGEVRLFVEEPAEEPAEQAPAVQPEQPAAEAAAEPQPDADAQRTAEVKEKTRTAAVHLFGDEEPEEQAPAAEEEPDDEPEQPAPAAEEYEDPADAKVVAASLHSGLTRRTVSMVVTGVIALVLLVLGLSAQGILLLATPLDPEIAPQAFLGVNLGLLAVAAVLSLNVMKEGMAGLLGKPSPHILPAVTVLAAVLQLAVCLLLPAQYDPAKTAVFAPLAVLLLCADHLGARMMQQVVQANFALVSAEGDHTAAYCLKDTKLAELLTAGMDEKEPVVLLSRPATLVRDFVAQSFSARRSDAKARKMALILLAGAVLGAVLSLVRGGGVVGAVTALAGVLCLGAPLSATLVAAVPGRLMQRAASKAGAVVPGWYNVEQLSRVDAVQVDASELFGEGCAELEGIKTFRKERIDLAILYATSVLIEGCNTLSGLFRAMIEDKTEMLYEVKDLQRKPGLGVVAWCDNCRVVMGNRAMMAQEDIALPPLDYENRYTKDGAYQALYLAVSGQLYALFVLRYRGRRKVKESLSVLEREGVRLLVTCQDPTLTAERIEAAYKLRPGYVKVLDAEEQTALEPATRYMPASEGCMMHQGSFASLMGGLKAASGASEGERSARQVQTIGVLFSVVLGLLLAFTGGISGMSLLAMVLYQLAWSGLSVAIALTKKY